MSNYIQQNITYRSPSIVWILFNEVKRKLVLVHMVCINGTDFRNDSKWQDTAPWAKPIYHCVLSTKLFSGDM